jgi:hypothetical protein
VSQQRAIGPVAFAASAALLASILAWSPAHQVATVSAAEPTPVAQWTFDEGSGSVAHDSVGDLDGALSSGASFTLGNAPQGSGALTLDGTAAGVVTIANAPTLEPAGDFSVSVWVQSSDIDFIAQRVLIQKGFYGCDIGGSWALQEHPNVAMGWVHLAAVGGSVYSTTMWGVTPWDGDWHRLVMVVDDGDDVTRMWIDGYKAQVDWPNVDHPQFGPSGRLDDALLLGSPGTDCQFRKPFEGQLDDLQLFDTALTDAQVLSMYPAVDTTTTVDVGQLGTYGISSVLHDQDIQFRARVDPFPGQTGEAQWYLAKDGGPETPLGTTSVQANGNAVAFRTVTAKTLEAGSYTIRAAFLGTSNWNASTSEPLSFDVVKRPVIAELSAAPTSEIPGGTTTLTARLRVEHPPESYVVTGSVEFYETSPDGDVLIGTDELMYVGQDLHWNHASISVSGLSIGTHHYEARYVGTSALGGASAVTEVDVEPQGSSLTLSVDPNPVETSGSATARVELGTFRNEGSGPALPNATGTISLRRATGGAVVGTASVNGHGSYLISVPPQPVGAIGLVAEYSGDSNFRGSSTEAVNLVVVEDTVHASGVTVSMTNFYPVKDGYRDTMAIKGTRLENASVGIRVYNSSNRIVKSAAVPAGFGLYSVTWNGRTSSGSLLAAGKYRVVQTLQDDNGFRLAVTKYVTLSHKKLVYLTTYVTRLGSSVSAKGDSGTGSIAISTSGGYARLTGKYPSGWVGVGYQFTLPSAPVYKSIAFQVYANGAAWAGGSTFGLQNFTSCPYIASSTWNVSCFDHWDGLGSSPVATQWYSTGGSVTHNRSGRYVRGIVSVPVGTMTIYKARVKVVYGVLR